MNTNTIEKLERKRYLDQLLGTVAVFVMFAGIIGEELVSGSNPMGYVTGIMAFCGFIMVVIYLWRRTKMSMYLKKNPDVKRALNNEFYLHYSNKASNIGLSAVGLVCIAFMIFANPNGYINFLSVFSARLAATTIALAGITAQSIAWLIYNRRRHEE